MDELVLLVVAATILCWGAFSARLQRADLTAPIVFTGVGAILAEGGLVSSETVADALRPLVELTLVWLLFSDAARVRIRDLRSDAGRDIRLLAIGLPLTVLAGWALAVWILPDLGGWLALVVAGALAPTDAALGAAVMTNPGVPSRVRRLLSVESGLNDGLATPVVLIALAGAAAGQGLAAAPDQVTALIELAIGVGVGGSVGGAGGWLLRLARHRGWVAEDFAGIAVLALALAAHAAALLAHGNGFVAAFCGGLAFGATAGRRGPAELALTEQAGGLVSLLVWLGFGAVAVPILIDRANWTVVGYAVLSLTVVRMIPVAVALVGTGSDRRAVLFIGWFGPRGLASLLLALLAMEELGRPTTDQAVAVIAVTVFLSVLAHGLTAAPLANRYGPALQRGA